jgi:hypothetical protein
VTNHISFRNAQLVANKGRCRSFTRFFVCPKALVISPKVIGPFRCNIIAGVFNKFRVLLPCFRVLTRCAYSNTTGGHMTYHHNSKAHKHVTFERRVVGVRIRVAGYGSVRVRVVGMRVG